MADDAEIETARALLAAAEEYLAREFEAAPETNVVVARGDTEMFKERAGHYDFDEIVECAAGRAGVTMQQPEQGMALLTAFGFARCAELVDQFVALGVVILGGTAYVFPRASLVPNESASAADIAAAGFPVREACRACERALAAVVGPHRALVLDVMARRPDVDHVLVIVPRGHADWAATRAELPSWGIAPDAVVALVLRGIVAAHLADDGYDRLAADVLFEGRGTATQATLVVLTAGPTSYAATMRVHEARCAEAGCRWCVVSARGN